MKKAMYLFAAVLLIGLASGSLSAQQVRLDAGTKLLVPSSAHTQNFTSFLAVINLDNQPNQVTITARNAAGSVIGTPLQRVISVGGRFRSTDILGEMGIKSDAFGPITIESTNGKVLTAVSEVSTNSSGNAGFFPGVNVSSAWMEGYIPEVIVTGGKGVAGTFRTNLGLNTIDGTPANVHVTLYDNTGTALGSGNTTVPGNGLTQISPISSLIPQLNGTNGFLKIESNRPIHAWASKINNNPGNDDPSFQIGVGALSGSVSSITPPVSDFRNNVLFFGLALIVPLLLLLRRTGGSSVAGIDQPSLAMEML
jgi:hypothetical protein